MKRIDALAAVMSALTTEPVVVTLGHTAQELYKLGDRPETFYMLGSMGMATPIAHGIALARPDSGKVIAIDGDAAVTMNLGALATIGLNLPPALIVVILDNRANGATGFQPSMTAARLKLDDVARGCGIAQIAVVAHEHDLRTAMVTALRAPGPHLILANIESGTAPDLDVIRLPPETIRNRFRTRLWA